MNYLDSKNLIDIVNVINQGNVIAVPTDTVYGLVCLANNQNAIDRVYQIKNRSLDKPLPILVSDWNQAQKIGIFDNELIDYIDSNFFKGKVTIIVKKQTNFNKINYWKKWEKVAIRITNSEFIKNIISKTGPLVATSCNISNQEPINYSNQIKLPALQYVVKGKIVDAKASTVYDSILKKIIRS